MLKLNNTEIYSSRMASGLKVTVDGVIKNRLAKNIGVIAPNQIELEIGQLKQKNRKTALQIQSLDLYERHGGRIRLFNLATNTGLATIPPFIPFTIAGRVPANGIKNNEAGEVPCVFVNMHGMGAWNSDDTMYTKLNAHQDLASALETGIVVYKLAIEGKTDKLLSNPKVLQPLTAIYKTLFTKTMSKVTGTTYGRDDFQRDLGNFIVARFFLKYVLQKTDNISVDQIAHVSIKPKSTLSALQMDADFKNIDYTSLSGFLKTFGEEMFLNDVKLTEFSRAWISLYGEGMLLASEYLPFLLHFLFAVTRGTNLGNTSKLTNIRPALEVDGLSRLYLTSVEILGS